MTQYVEVNFEGIEVGELFTVAWKADTAPKGKMELTVRLLKALPSAKVYVPTGSQVAAYAYLEKAGYIKMDTLDTGFLCTPVNTLPDGATVI